jgi:hypothetical protein
LREDSWELDLGKKILPASPISSLGIQNVWGSNAYTSNLKTRRARPKPETLRGCDLEPHFKPLFFLQTSCYAR